MSMIRRHSSVGKRLGVKPQPGDAGIVDQDVDAAELLERQP